MNPPATDRSSRDLLSNRITTTLVYWLPILVLIASGFFEIGLGWRTGIWTAALTIMGAACVANALRCGRVHCYVTGPFLLVMAIIALLYGLGILRIGRDGWNALGLIVLIGFVVTYWLPERLFGRYRIS
jgi:hypothetical protein